MKVSIKIKKINKYSKLFNIYSDDNSLLFENITRNVLIRGFTIDISDTIKNLIIEALGKFGKKRIFPITTSTYLEFNNIKYTLCNIATTYKHLTNVKLYNNYYNQIEPYIIEYTSSYKLQDELLQNITDYSKVFTYLKNDSNLFDNNLKIQVDDKWFNKAIIYNSQQSSGLLELAQKPVNNMAIQFQYPKYNNNSKTILYTKSDNLYNYNTFWSLQKDSQQPLFLNSCQSLSIDKVINDSNMDYGMRNFKKAPLRAKDIKIRHILDDTSDINIVSQFLISNTQISYK